MRHQFGEFGERLNEFADFGFDGVEGSLRQLTRWQGTAELLSDAPLLKLIGR